MLSVALGQPDRAPQLPGSRHGSGEAHVPGMVRQVETGADGDLEGVTHRLRTRPAPVSGAEEPSFGEVRPPVIRRSLLTVEAPLDFDRPGSLLWSLGTPGHRFGNSARKSVEVAP